MGRKITSTASLRFAQLNSAPQNFSDSPLGLFDEDREGLGIRANVVGQVTGQDATVKGLPDCDGLINRLEAVLRSKRIKLGNEC